MLASLEGTCVFTPEQIKSRMESVKEQSDVLRSEIAALERQSADAATIAQEMRQQHQRLLSWADMFDTVSPEEKKVIASYLIKAVTLTRNYGIQIEFNISEAQYLNGMEMV